MTVEDNHSEEMIKEAVITIQMKAVVTRQTATKLDKPGGEQSKGNQNVM
jgi:hypothetical protein